MWKVNGKATDNEASVQRHFNLKYLPMCKSLLDIDAYKLSMGLVYHNQFGKLHAEWDFKARNIGADKALPEPYTEADIAEITRQIQAYCSLRFDEEELNYLNAKLPWIKPEYVNFLKFWHPCFDDFSITGDGGTGLTLSFKGIQEYITYYEIPVLEICAEVYYRNHFDYKQLFRDFQEKTEAKIQTMKTGDWNFGVWSEFGARRRVSYEAQDWLIKRLTEEKDSSPVFAGFLGTSNVHLARKYGLTPVGTVAHEYVMCVGQGYPQYNPAYSNKFAMEAWVKEYGVWNGIWLTDTIGDELCRRDMQTTYATLFSGVRNDSGDPFEWGDHWIAHYKKLGIDPQNKTLLFSNSIDSLELWNKLATHFAGRAKPAFGIGTFWTGPQTIKPLNIVAKVVQVNGLDVAKLSDDEGKTMSRNEEYVQYLKRTLDWRLKSEV